MRAAAIATLLVVFVVIFNAVAKIVVSQLPDVVVLLLLVATVISIWFVIYKALR